MANVAVYDPNVTRAEVLAKQFKAELVTDLNQSFLIDADVALIASPTSCHLAQAIMAARAHCHLFIEKPLAADSNGVKELIDEVRKRDLVTLVGCNLRFHPGIAHIKKLLDSNAIGTIVAARAEVGYWLPAWRPNDDYRQSYSAQKLLGGGILLDAIHEIDYMQWFFGDVSAVACFMDHRSGLEIDTEDVAALMLRFSGGVIGQIHLDYVQRSYSRTCHVIGTEGTIRWDYSKGEVHVYQADQMGWEVIANPPDWTPNQMYLDELAHFLECIVGQERSVNDVAAAAVVLNTTLAAKRASEESTIATPWN